MQKDLILQGDGLRGKQEFLSKRQESQTFSKADEDLTTSFTERQEHSCTVTVSV